MPLPFPALISGFGSSDSRFWFPFPLIGLRFSDDCGDTGPLSGASGSRPDGADDGFLVGLDAPAGAGAGAGAIDPPSCPMLWFTPNS